MKTKLRNEASAVEIATFVDLFLVHCAEETAFDERTKVFQKSRNVCFRSNRMHLNGGYDVLWRVQFNLVKVKCAKSIVQINVLVWKKHFSELFYLSEDKY